MTYWIIYTYKNQLSGTMATLVTGDTLEEIETNANEWVNSKDDIEVIDLAETIYSEEE